MSDRLRTRPAAVSVDARRPRLVGVDVARALALAGMMSTHLLAASADGRTVSWSQQLAGGRAAALFAVLAGVSLALLTGREHPLDRRETTAARAGIVVRALLIGTLGLVLGALDTGIAVILTYYGLLFCAALPFLRLRWQTLAALAVAWAVLAPVLSHLVRPLLPERIGASPTLAWVVQPARLMSELTFTGYYPVLAWIAYLLVGLALGRLPLHRAQVAAVVAGGGAALAAAAWGSSWLLVHRLGGIEVLRATAPSDGVFDYLSVDQALVRGTSGTTPTTSWWWLTVSAPHSSTPFDLLHTIGSAMLVLGLCLLAGRVAAPVLGTVFAAGAMSLTVYSLHLVALHLELGQPRETAELFWWHASTALALTALWRVAVGRGPFEAVVGVSADRVRTATSTTLGLSPPRR